MLIRSVVVATAAVAAVLALSMKPAEAPTAVKADQAVTTNQPVADSPILLDIGNGHSGIQTLQAGGGTLPRGWKPDDPLDLTGDMPSDEEVRGAIVRGVEFLLSNQKEDGSWDVVLTGTLLSQTADQAVDAIAATSLAGYALRRHVDVDPARIEPALRKAADFIMDRVYRGKLPTKVWYANWRYTLGMKFLHAEYMAHEDIDRRSELKAVTRRMIQAMMRIQLSNGEDKFLDRKRKTRISSRYEDIAMPAKLGIVLAIPTDEDYRGGALVTKVIEGSIAARSGVKAGDRVVEAEGVRVENAVDYYLMEAGWVGKQRVKVKFKRDAGYYSKDVGLPLDDWPAYTGLQVEEAGGEGVRIKGFLPGSPAKRAGAQVGDLIIKLSKDVTSVEEFKAQERELEAGKKVRMKVIRGEKDKETIKFELSVAPNGNLGFGIEEEDKEGEAGVIVGQCPEGSPAYEAGIREGDRVTWVGYTPILSLDHFAEFFGNTPAGVPVEVKWTREGTEMKGTVIPLPMIEPGDPGMKPHLKTQRDYFRPTKISEVTKGGPADKAGIKKNDVITAINGRRLRFLYDYVILMRNAAALDEVTFSVQRGSKTWDVTLTLEKQKGNTGPKVEEGGWAYYPNMGEAPSFSTAAALMVMYKVIDDMDFKKTRSLRDSIEAGEKLLDSLRERDPAHANSETYIYRAGSRAHPNNVGIDIRGCQGRNTCCELALFQARERRKGDLKDMLEQFMKYRGELDAVRRMEYYQPPRRRGSPHNGDRWHNAAYYWMFGHYYARMAAKEVGGSTDRELNEVCVKALMQTRLDDGTWLGHPSFGKVCGTSLALWILGECEGGFRKHESGSTVTPSSK